MIIPLGLLIVVAICFPKSIGAILKLALAGVLLFAAAMIV